MTMQTQKPKLSDRCVGRWASLLPMLGVPMAHLKNRHGPCPMCGGTDRFRFDDKDGKGTWICSHCGSGNGIDLALKITGLEFRDLMREVDKLLPDATVVMPKAQRSDAEKRYTVDRIWRRALPLNGLCPASRYLIRRGLSMPGNWPTQLRYLPEARYRHEDKSVTLHHGMVAQFVAPDLAGRTVHITYLTEDGRKADLPKTKMLAPAPVPRGGAVRLFPSAETMGVAEGIETALSAARLYSMPVWSCLSADGLLKWEPPQHVRKVVIFGDADKSFAGQHVAYGLAYRLASKGIEVLPTLPDELDIDWNDVLNAEQTLYTDDSSVLV